MTMKPAALRQVPASKANQAPVVRAVDVGFGLVKLSMPDEESPGDVRFMHFPSMAITSDPSTIRTLGTRKRDTFNVPVDGGSYEVGLDVQLAQTGGDFGREITDEFYKGAIYAALVKGALRYMHQGGDTEIDVLVMGLPVNQFEDEGRRNLLAQRYSGEIDLGDGITMTVKNVLVQPQPMGGYIELSTRIKELNAAISEANGALKPLESADAFADLTVLIVDPGEHTLDWLLIQAGAPNTKASGAASDAGRHRVVRAVLEALQAKVGRPLGPAVMPRINEALRTNSPLKLSGVMHDLTEFEPIIKSVVADPIHRLVDGLRGMHETLDVIALVGGHPERYRDALVERFPSIPVYVVEESTLANVRGFQLIGMATAASTDE